MKKVDELLKLAGLDETVVKSITEKLATEKVELTLDADKKAEGEKVEEAAVEEVEKTEVT